MCVKYRATTGQPIEFTIVPEQERRHSYLLALRLALRLAFCTIVAAPPFNGCHAITSARVMLASVSCKLPLIYDSLVSALDVRSTIVSAPDLISNTITSRCNAPLPVLSKGVWNIFR